MIDHEGDFMYLAYCSNANWTIMPTKYGARVAEAAGPVHGQTTPMVTIGIIRLSDNTETDAMRSAHLGPRII